MSLISIIISAIVFILLLVVLLALAGILIFQSHQQFLKTDKYDILRLALAALILILIFVVNLNLTEMDVFSVLLVTFFLLALKISIQTITSGGKLRIDEKDSQQKMIDYEQHRVIMTHKNV